MNIHASILMVVDWGRRVCSCVCVWVGGGGVLMRMQLDVNRVVNQSLCVGGWGGCISSKFEP